MNAFELIELQAILRAEVGRATMDFCNGPIRLSFMCALHGCKSK